MSHSWATSTGCARPPFLSLAGMDHRHSKRDPVSPTAAQENLTAEYGVSTSLLVFDCLSLHMEFASCRYLKVSLAFGPYPVPQNLTFIMPHPPNLPPCDLASDTHTLENRAPIKYSWLPVFMSFASLKSTNLRSEVSQKKSVPVLNMYILFLVLIL